MFRNNNKLVCIKNAKHKSRLTIGETYYVRGIASDYHIWITDDNGMMDVCLRSYFATELEFRRLKLNKIKENICLKSVIE